MFNEPSGQISPGLPRLPEYPSSSGRLKRLAIIVGAVVVAAAIIFGLVLSVRSYLKRRQEAPAPAQTEAPASSTPNLPHLNGQGDGNGNGYASSTDIAIEYLAFADFYIPPSSSLPEGKPADYELPVNVKMDAVNYYDLSRKLNLDPGLDNLNQAGFTWLDNPWPKEASDFYSLYAKLEERQIPVVLTADFIAYYYQNVLKKSFKDIEENVFYDNLWDICYRMYESSKIRYENRLAAIGNINDSVLEGERLATAYFAVALEILKPAEDQKAVQGQADESKFSSTDVSRFYFVVPPYLRDDVLAEAKLIRAAKGEAKSPVLLYRRDYSEFKVPADYQRQAKLNNFYLTTKWLNSVFPLEIKGDDCPDCRLDREDWRINLIGASFIASDFAAHPELKNRWARIYKVMAFFKGLREDLSYVQYKDGLAELFGADYDPARIFNDANPEAAANLERFRARLLQHEFLEIQGALDKAEQAPDIGFKLLAEPYWPNNYIFDRLVYPATGLFQGAKLGTNNVTACLIQNRYRRCNGSAYDIVNLLEPIAGDSYFSENSAYEKYPAASAALKAELGAAAIWHTANYWSSLYLMKSYLATDYARPVFATSPDWLAKEKQTAAAIWANFQMPLENYSVRQVVEGRGLENLPSFQSGSYIEPNIRFFDELLAFNDMVVKMFSALGLEAEVGLASQRLQEAGDNLETLRAIVAKELAGQPLDEADNQMIASFSKYFEVQPLSAADKQLAIKSPAQRNSLKADLSRLKLMVIAHKENGSLTLSVGPAWDYRESH